MSARVYPTLPATVQLVGPWTEEARAQVITTLTPLIPALFAPRTLTYERDPLGTGKRAAIAEGYSAAVERDGAAQRVIARCWDLGMYLRQLAAHIRAQAEAQATPEPTLKALPARRRKAEATPDLAREVAA